ncbi:MAG: TonB-dependent receptor [Calditrichaceae bacterium]|nr:TonB-dependent receptor [Calditrichaceae bacterium]MBN2710539.1 TonB-dependent receptor [Calditrichaceae bacterium]RQV96547.1 MAG: TonB-dependent receptor [Calditrichota bacterium]
MKQLSLFIMLLFATTCLSAQEISQDSLETYELEDSILVIGSRYQTTLKRVASNYQIISAKDIKQMSTHSPLQLVDIQFPSAYVLEKRVIGYGVGTDGAGTVNIRGMGGKPNSGILVLLNGHPDFMGIFGHPLPDVYGTDNIQQMEILPGASSTVFGSNAMGGVVNIVTQPNFSTPLNISLEGGSFGTYNAGLRLAKKFGDYGGSISIRTKHTDGHEPKTSFTSFNLQTDWLVQFNPVWSLSFSARYVPYEFDDAVRADNDTANLGTYGKIERGTGEIILHNKFNKLTGSTQVYANMGKHRFYDGFKSNDFAYGLSTYQYWEQSKLFQFAAGADLMQYGGKAENRLSTLPNGQPSVNEDNKEYRSFGAYLKGFASPVQMLQLRAGARVQYQSENDWNWAPTAGVSIFPVKNIQLFANYQFGFRLPTMRELYLFPSANPDLEPEKSDMYEAGLRFDYLLSNSVQLTLYQNEIKNMIQPVPNPNFPPPPKEIFQNSKDDKQKGIELQFLNKWFEVLNTMVSYGFLEVDYLTYLNPKHQIKYMLSFNQYGLAVSVYGKYVEDLYANNGFADPMQDYHIINFSTSYDLGNIELNFKLLNLLDRKYDYYPGYKAPGIHLLGGLSYSL